MRSWRAPPTPPKRYSARGSRRLSSASTRNAWRARRRSTGQFRRTIGKADRPDIGTASGGRNPCRIRRGSTGQFRRTIGKADRPGIRTASGA
jgi:hypothetical protein